MDSYKKTIALGKQAMTDPCGIDAPPPPVPDDLVKAILAARKKQA